MLLYFKLFTHHWHLFLTMMNLPFKHLGKIMSKMQEKSENHTYLLTHYLKKERIV